MFLISRWNQVRRTQVRAEVLGGESVKRETIVMEEDRSLNGVVVQAVGYL
jgi:hypothetical protein